MTSFTRVFEHGVTCWVCPDCAFTFDSSHTDQDGGYSCPLCAESELLAEVERLRAAARPM